MSPGSYLTCVFFVVLLTAWEICDIYHPDDTHFDLSPGVLPPESPFCFPDSLDCLRPFFFFLLSKHLKSQSRIFFILFLLLDSFVFFSTAQCALTKPGDKPSRLDTFPLRGPGKSCGIWQHLPPDPASGCIYLSVWDKWQSCKGSTGLKTRNHQSVFVFFFHPLFLTTKKNNPASLALNWITRTGI